MKPDGLQRPFSQPPEGLRNEEPNGQNDGCGDDVRQERNPSTERIPQHGCDTHESLRFLKRRIQLETCESVIGEQVEAQRTRSPTPPLQPATRLGAIANPRGYCPRRSSVRTDLATAFSVSKTPAPLVAQASNSGALVGFSTSRSCSSGAAFGRSRLLYWTTYGSLSRL